VAASCTVRRRMPGRWGVREAGMIPARLTRLCVATMPTMLLLAAGLRAEGAVSSPMAQVTRLAATAAPEPPLERPALRLVSYGLKVAPPWVLGSPEAYWPRSALPGLMARAFRRRAPFAAWAGGRWLAWCARAPLRERR